MNFKNEKESQFGLSRKSNNKTYFSLFQSNLSRDGVPGKRASTKIPSKDTIIITTFRDVYISSYVEGKMKYLYLF